MVSPYFGMPCVICNGHYKPVHNTLVTSNGPACFTCIDNWVGDVLQMRTPWDKSQWGEDE